MADRSPPKKKSRFFASGKSKIGSLLQPLKKKVQKDGDETEDESGNGSDSDNGNENENESPHYGTADDTESEGSPLLANIHPRPLLASSESASGPSHFLSQPQHGATSSTSISLGGHFRDRGGQQRAGNPRQPDPSDSEAETETQSSSGEKEDEEEYDSSDEENKKPTTEEETSQSARKQRRQGIYGVEDLLPPGSSNTAGATVTKSIFGPSAHMEPPPTPRRPGPQDLHRLPQGLTAIPPGNNNYTFSGVPSNPNVVAAGGNYNFNFHTAQAFPNPPSGQHFHPHNLQHPVGSGLARMAQQDLHADTGPLGDRDRARTQTQVRALVQERTQARAQGQAPTTPNQPIAATTPTRPYVDLDRDQHGHLLAQYQRSMAPRPQAHHGIARPVIQVRMPPANPDLAVPDFLYTSANRIERAQTFARVSLKRKRPESILPPPSYVYQHTGDPGFNIFSGFLLYPELCFALATHLPVKDLISLYAISKDFHVILDTRFTTVMLSQAMTKAPESARTFMFRTYAHLCRNDPAARIPHPNTHLAAQGVSRKIPSFRWLKMVLHREKTIHELMTVFAENGIPLPARCSLALKRLWVMMDMPDNARRIGYLHNKELMTDLDLYFGACFITKLDMFLNDPASGEKRDGLRKLLLGQRSFTTILKVLKRDIWTTRYELMKAWIRYKYHPPHHEAGQTMFGVPGNQVGRGRLEYWGFRTAQQVGHAIAPLMRPDQLIPREAFRRGMRFEKHFLRFLLYGYVRPDTLENYEPRKYGRRIAELRDEEYELDDAVGGVAALSVDDEGFDPLLDLGQPRVVSAFTIVKDKTVDAEVQLRKREEEFLDRCIKWWEREQEKERQHEREMENEEPEGEEANDNGDKDGDAAPAEVQNEADGA